jgi:2-keto-4-pentenoate hydratase/2-oxohepta-3-ene-1,7-dioic acid hydratase in catechol pathway
MRIIRFERGGQVVYGCAEGQQAYILDGSPFDNPKRGESAGPMSGIRLLAPCEPTKIVAVGLNYRSHALEMGHDLPAEPMLFLKPSTSVVGPQADVVYPEMSKRVDYEAELAVVIGRRTRMVATADAQSHILGYTCGNDVTARDLQKKDGQWTRSKGFDTFCPLGPWIVTDLEDPNQVNLVCRVNGEIKQSGNTNDLVFNAFELVSFISRIMTLEPGDVVMTGTPAGIAPVFRGDVMEIEVEGIGTLKNGVV